jgi:phosphohistidine phosphatase
VHTLYLLRHAKSSWSDSSLADHDRPLAPRGVDAVGRLATYIDEAGIRPAVVLCSSATRAQDTLDGVLPSLGADADVLTEDGLYGADSRQLVDRLRRLPPGCPSAMVIGHNPGLHDLAFDLAGAGDERQLARLHNKFPTGALAALGIADTWKSLSPGSATLTVLVVPRDLPPH